MITAKKNPDTKKILYLEGDVNYTLIHFYDGRSELSSHTLLRHQERLTGFVRISKKYLVNPGVVRCITPKGELQLLEGTRLVISRRKRTFVKAIFSNQKHV